ncbi:hypothetical protein KIN20_010531 [Parelaphostrongylus tenuis]|uniref:Mos1 transposase HTH domain-containing protein n=1 Tax=Parelaphostrongylus tenuis TaxID=148309 RepID=A0AAD5M7Z8_PARTN|nr:hypothetical protein KIN20_010531 [Parelaphostrongylus tenuis]
MAVGFDATVVSERNNQTYREDGDGKSAVYRWFKMFDEGEESLEERQSLSRSKEVDRQAVLEVIGENPSLTPRMFADDFDCDHKRNATFGMSFASPGRNGNGSHTSL